MPKYSKKLFFTCCICLEDKHTIKQPCNNDEHRICISCITRIVKTIPISINKPNITCQYPFSECKEIYCDFFIKFILLDDFEIYRKAKNAYSFSELVIKYCAHCKEIICFDEEPEYDSLYECVHCLRFQCFTCLRVSEDPREIECESCKSYEYINPNSKNFFFIKNKDRIDKTDYFYINKNILPEEACNQLVDKLETGAVKCPCCSTNLYRTEQCNALSHCHIEICFWCGMFTDVGDELNDHWSARGYGCMRWNTDPVFKKYIPGYMCKEDNCYNHEIGECILENHKPGIEEYNIFKKKQFLYHSLKSLLPRIRYKVLELLPEKYKKYLPRDTTFDDMDCKFITEKETMVCSTEL